MFPEFGATSESLAKASTLVLRIGSDAHLYDDPENGDITALLDSKYDSEKCEALKRLLALIAQGFDVSNFFPQVVKNVASQSLEVKKLVYLYLLHYADKRPNEALLSINCFQKDLGDPNPLVRAWALRAMTGIRLHAISPLVFAAVNKCARDPSSYVRKCVANSLPKLHDVCQEENASEIQEVVQLLLSDNSPGVSGAAALAFAIVCPNSLFLIGKGYRRLCEALPDVEEWGQILLIEILLRYVIARNGLAGESVMFSSLHAHGPSSIKGNSDVNTLSEEHANMKNCMPELELKDRIFQSYFEGPNEYLSHSSFTNMYSSDFGSVSFTSGTRNDDIKLLLQCTSPLLWSRNGAVVIAAATVHWIMAPIEDIKKIVRSLLFLLRSSKPSRYMVLCNIHMFVKALPSLFALHYEDFFICSSDSYEIKVQKLEILSAIATDSSISFIYEELQDYVRDPDRTFAADAVASIGLCATRFPKAACTIEKGLLAVMRQEASYMDGNFVDSESRVLVQAVLSLKTIIKLDPLKHEKVVVKLIRALDSIKTPAGRAVIIWMVGEYHSLGKVIPSMLIPVLKYLARCFISESSDSKFQILNTTAKVLLNAEDDSHGTIKKLSTYLLELAKCDDNYDLRDRACFMERLLSVCLHPPSSGVQTQDNNVQLMLAKNIFGGEMKLPVAKSSDSRFFLPGSLSLIVGHAAPGYTPLPKPCSLSFQNLSQCLGSSYETGSSDGSRYSVDTLSDSQTEERDSIRSSSQGGDSIDSPVEFSQEKLLEEKQMMAEGASEPWLSEDSLSEQCQVKNWFADMFTKETIGVNSPKAYTLLDPATGNGLKADYSFSSEISTTSSFLVCVDITFQNCSTELVSNIAIIDDSDIAATNQPLTMRHSAKSPDIPTVIPMEEIPMLEPGSMAKRTLQVYFHHHLLPVKLHLLCNDKKFVVKLHPDIGYFVRPFPLDLVAFLDKESNLRGMFEYVRGFTFVGHIEQICMDAESHTTQENAITTTCKSLAEKMLRNANLALVSADCPMSTTPSNVAGLCLRFSCEILQTSVPCLITLMPEGDCNKPLHVSVKINSEETVFALNLLNRIVSFLSEP